MSHVEATGIQVFGGTPGGTAPFIYVIDSPDHPFDPAPFAGERFATIVVVPVASWGDALTPWPAAGLYRGEPDFGGKADVTLVELLDEAIPAIEAGHGLSPAARAICGYSLGGLFALYALAHSTTFRACACLSGSVWYEGWVEHLRSLEVDLTGRFAYLSVGTRERRAARPILKTVQASMEACAAILEEKGCAVEYRTGPGNHLQFVSERLDAGLAALDGFLRGCPSPRG